MAYVRKTKDVWYIQGYYTPEYGFEDVCEAETFKEAKLLKKAYDENEICVLHRIVKRRERI